MVWHSGKLDTVLDALGADPVYGLSTAEVANRLKKNGPNRLRAGKPRSIFERGWDKLRTLPILLPLLVCISIILINFFTALLGEETNILPFFVFIVLIFTNVAFSVFFDIRTDHRLEKLADLRMPNVIVFRGGDKTIVPAAELVEGDIILLEEGSLVPADCRIIESAGFICDESGVVGHSFVAEKHSVNDLAPGIPLAKRQNMVFLGDSVLAGRCRAVVTAVGMQTELGTLYAMREGDHSTLPETQRNFIGFTHKSTYVSLIICVFSAIIAIVRGRAFSDAVFDASAVFAVSLPVCTVSATCFIFAVGAARLTKIGVVITKLASIEPLALTTTVMVPNYAPAKERRSNFSLVRGRVEEHIFDFTVANEYAEVLMRLAVLGNYSGAYRDALLSRAKAIGMNPAALDAAYPLIRSGDSLCLRNMDGRELVIAIGEIDEIRKYCDDSNLISIGGCDSTLAVAYNFRKDGHDPEGLRLAGLLGFRLEETVSMSTAGLPDLSSAGIQSAYYPDNNAEDEIERLTSSGEQVLATGNSVKYLPLFRKASTSCTVGAPSPCAASALSDARIASTDRTALEKTVRDCRGIVSSSIRALRCTAVFSLSAMLLLLIGSIFRGISPISGTAVAWLPIVIALPAFSFAFSPAAADTMLRPPKNGNKLISTRSLSFIVLYTVIITVCAYISYLLGTGTFEEPTPEIACAMSFITLAFGMVFLFPGAKSRSFDFPSLIANPHFLIAEILSILLIVLAFLPPFRDLIGFDLPSVKQFIISIALALPTPAVCAAIKARKYIPAKFMPKRKKKPTK